MSCSNIYVLNDWKTACHCACKKNPYTVVPLEHDLYVDFHGMAKDVLQLDSLEKAEVDEIDKKIRGE